MLFRQQNIRTERKGEKVYIMHLIIMTVCMYVIIMSLFIGTTPETKRL